MRKKKDVHGKPVYSKQYNSDDRKHRSKNHHSIIQKHQNKLEEFRNKEMRIKAIRDKIRVLQKEHLKMSKDRSYKQLNEEDVSDIDITLYKIKSEISVLEEQEHTIESGEDELEYLLNSSNIIFQYTSLDDKEALLLETKGENDDELNDISNQKAILINEYLNKFGNESTKQSNLYDIESLYCRDCNIQYDIEDGYVVCSQCGLCDNSMIQAEDLSFKEMRDYEYRPQFTYDKLSHLEDWIKRFQSKENRAIPQEILDKILLEAQKERIKDLNLLTEDKVKKYLKKLSLNDYYDNVIGIINRINGRPPFKLTPEIENKIKTMFQQIQEPYERYKPKGRKNFLSYSYVLCKLFQILGLHEFATYFPLLKSIDKLRQQDDIFRKIVAEMSQKDNTVKWVFYPSI